MEVSKPRVFCGRHSCHAAAPMVVALLCLLARSSLAEHDTSRASELQDAVMRPLAEQLADLNKRGLRQAEAVDSGRVRLIRPDLKGKYDFGEEPGWVILVVQPFLPKHFTTSYTRYEDPVWEWARPDEEAKISYVETLFTKTADSVEELQKLEWLKTMTRTHVLRAEYRRTQWEVEELPANVVPGIIDPANRPPALRPGPLQTPIPSSSP